jgi:hypothetical protein
MAVLRGFIAGRDSCPLQLAIFAELVSPAMVPQPDGSNCKVMPNMYRSILGQFLGPGGDRIMLRVVAVNSYYFHLIVPLKKLPQVDFDSAVNQFADKRKGVVRLSPGLSKVTIHTSPQDGIRSIIPQLRAYREQYSKFFAKKRSSQ